MEKQFELIDYLSGSDLVLHEILTLVMSFLLSNTIQSLPRNEDLELTDPKGLETTKRMKKLILLKLRGLEEALSLWLKYASMRATSLKISNTFRH